MSAINSFVHNQRSLGFYRDVVTDLNTWVHSTFFRNFEWVHSSSYSAILKSTGARAPMAPTLTTPLQPCSPKVLVIALLLSAVKCKLGHTSHSAFDSFGCYYTELKITLRSQNTIKLLILRTSERFLILWK